MLSVFTWEVQFGDQLSHPFSSGFQPSVQLPVAFPGTVEHAVEVQTAQFQVGADLVFIFLLDIKALQDLAISLGEFAQELSHPLRLLRLQNEIQLAGSSPGDQLGRLGIGNLFRPARSPVVIRRQIPRETTYEPRELLGLANFSPPDLFESELKCFLGKIFRQGTIPGGAIEND